ncbi:Delta 8-(E)-sphingolipid desaturase-2 [Elsinoe australis]|uniref:Delta 8-(E)-sphingolipid desaturase n=1 Tax=Elsinoe australis TaxID=40998 RepID=A0A4U7ASE7_9PEZI|nr:Delta 8-(E)-sphingolipid desaturase-2 [Elsinoe australis]
MGRDNVIQAGEIERRINAGETLVVFEGMVLKLDNWLSKHPGGKLAIMHMVGRDATDQIQIYHSQQVQKTMRAFRIGRVQAPWINLTPPIQKGMHKDVEAIIDTKDTKLRPDQQEKPRAPSMTRVNSYCKSMEKEKIGDPSQSDYADMAVREEIERDLAAYPSLDPTTQHAISEKYRLLAKRVEDEGFYQCDYWAYGRESLRYLLLFSCFMVALKAKWYITSACFLGLFWHQIMFTAHDAGHLAITHNFAIDTVIACFIADFCCGLSIGWWKSSHNVHHLVTNLPEHDPDIQNVPVFATSPSFFQSIHSSYYDFDFNWDAAADVAVPMQAWTYYPIMGIARFNLYLLSWLYLLSARSTSFGNAWWTRPLELVFMASYWFLFGYCLLWLSIPTWKLRIAFVLVSHIITMVLHVQITLSHFGMSTADLGTAESFAQHQLRTTMDVECPAWLDFFHGGLQFQAVHHLFPRVPRHNLRRLQVLVKEFANDINVEYKILGFVDGNKKVLGRLSDVANQAKLLYMCHK